MGFLVQEKRDERMLITLEKSIIKSSKRYSHLVFEILDIVSEMKDAISWGLESGL